MALFDLTGRVAVITGSSRGIGKAMALAMAEQGAKLVISSRKADACATTAGEINARFGPDTALACAANISRHEELEALAATAMAHFGRIDILVLNAAANPYMGPLLDVDAETFRAILDRNLLGNLRLVQAVAPDMIARGDGVILFTASIGAFMASPDLAPYGISKAATAHLARNLALELGPHNIRVNAIAPGLVRTDLARALWEDATRLAEVCRRTPLGRIAEPQEIAGMAVLLASDAGRFITGQLLTIDGGVSLASMP